MGRVSTQHLKTVHICAVCNFTLYAILHFVQVWRILYRVTNSKQAPIHPATKAYAHDAEPIIQLGIPYLDPEADEAQLGLREKKRIETMCAIKDHATRLVLANGYDAVTVDDICQAANISKRTFFNYAESKEDAVLGTWHTEIPTAAREEFLATPPELMFPALIKLGCTAGIANQGTHPRFALELMRRHKQIMHRKPNLMAAHVGTSIQRFRTFAALIDKYFANHPGTRTTETEMIAGSEMHGEQLPAVSTEAMAITHLVQDAIHIGVTRWLPLPVTEATLDALLNHSMAALATLCTVASTWKTNSETN